ncbi:MAG: biopolymer transporter ExbD [Deltaproteobacteria bacterium]|nr:biopolymer transporter ExbD [Deltaproteobacteria bacterium]
MGSIINEELTTDEPMTSINVTSLVDVMFCLLIMFMVATPLMSPDGEDVELPAARGEKISEEEFLYSVISIDRTGRAFLGPVPLATDTTKLKEEIANNVKIQEDGMVFIQGDQNVDHARIVDILVALKDAEVSQVGFVTDPNSKRIEQEQ